MKILGIILLVIIIAGVIYYFTQLKDRDGDGDIDLFVGRAGGNQIWVNDGAGGFTAASGGPAAGSDIYGALAVAAADIDGDGDQDVGCYC